jgi:spore coat protein U-like protein
MINAMNSRSRMPVRYLRLAVAAIALLSPIVGAWGNECEVGNVSLSFGAYQPLTFPGKLLSTAKDSDATMTVTCAGSSETTYAISLGEASNRRLQHQTDPGAPPMAFNLFMDTDRTVIWGDGVTGASLAGSATPDSPQTHTIYGRIPGGQHTLKAGDYAGSVTITVTYDP